MKVLTWGKNEDLRFWLFFKIHLDNCTTNLQWFDLNFTTSILIGVENQSSSTGEENQRLESGVGG